MGFFSRLFNQSPPSAQVANERLQLIIAHDRADISRETLETLKDDIISVISKRVEIDRDNVQVTVSNTSQGSRLVANIPLLRKRLPVKAPSAGAASTRGAKPHKAR